jgi:LPXTG-motif cell wall-anchored protein
MALNGYIYTGGGTTVNVGGTTNTTTPVITTAPGLPTTGGSSNALPTALVLVASGLVAFGSIRYGMKKTA